MTDPQEIALARFAVIAPLVTRKLSLAETSAVRKAILAANHRFPDDMVLRVSARTLRRWLDAYRGALPKGTVAALSALCPKPRSDRGVPRVFDPKVIEEAVALRQELATRSTPQLITHLKCGPKPATLAYHLRQRGVTRAILKARGQAFPRYEAGAPNVTWQSDVMDAFYLPDPTDPKKRREAHLMGFLDDHSRLIAHGEWYFKESLPCLLDCLKKAVLKHGVPSQLYWDNGPIYRSKQVELVAARLGTRIIFSTPYAPEGKGKIERFWKTTAASFLSEAEHAGIQTLEELNQSFWAWLDGYHRRVHGSTNMTPLERWEKGAETIRRVNPAEVADLFLWEETRLVKKTGTLSLSGNEYRVHDTLVGLKVQVRYDPLDLGTVKVYRDGQFVQIAAPYRMVAHTHRKATPKRKDEKYLPLPSSKRLIQGAIDHRKAEVDEAIEAVRPDTARDRFTLEGLKRLFLAEFPDRPLTPDEERALAAFFRRYSPFPKDRTTEALEAIVDRKGRDRHLAFYLDELAQALIGRKDGME